MKDVATVLASRYPSGRIRHAGADFRALSDTLLPHVKAHPGQRGERVAPAPVVHQLIDACKVRMKPPRKVMSYAPVSAWGGPPCPRPGGTAQAPGFRGPVV